MAEPNLEGIVNNRLNMSAIALPMIPTVIVGSAAMAFGQDYTASHTDNIHAIVAGGMGANIIARNPVYLCAHAFFNRKRLIKEGRIDWRRTAQDAASFFASSKIGYFIWAGSCVAASEYLLHKGYSPIEAGLNASLATSSAYALFIGAVTPRIDSIIKYTVNGIKKIKNVCKKKKAHESEL